MALIPALLNQKFWVMEHSVLLTSPLGWLWCVLKSEMSAWACGSSHSLRSLLVQWIRTERTRQLSRLHDPGPLLSLCVFLFSHLKIIHQRATIQLSFFLCVCWWVTNGRLCYPMLILTAWTMLSNRFCPKVVLLIAGPFVPALDLNSNIPVHLYFINHWGMNQNAIHSSICN